MEKQIDNLLSLYVKQNYILSLIRKLSSGKEAEIYLVTDNKLLYILKIYKDYKYRSFKHDEKYLSGKYYRHPNERKAIYSKNNFGNKKKYMLWVNREYYIMKKLNNSGINIPKIYKEIENSILMEYIGDEIASAPLLKDVKLNKKEKYIVYSYLLKCIEIMYSYGFVHADLSEFNILYWNKKAYIIDFPQTIDVRNNPNAESLLEKDRKNIENWFQKL